MGARRGQRAPVQGQLRPHGWRTGRDGNPESRLPELDCFSVYGMICCCCSTLQVQVPGRTHNTVLKNLQPDTDYTVTVAPVYPAGEGNPQSERGKTRKQHVVLLGLSEGEVRIRSGMLSRCDIFGRDDQAVFFFSLFSSSLHICPDQSFWPGLLARRKHACIKKFRQVRLLETTKPKQKQLHPIAHRVNQRTL